MAKNIFTDVRIFAGSADLTGASNKAEISAEAEDKDVTTFASSGWNERIGGLKTAEYSGEGYWEAGDEGKVDDHSWASLGTTIPTTICPTGAGVGNPAYTFKAFRKDFTFGGAVGDVAPWSCSGISNWPLVRGKVTHPRGVARTSSGDGAAVELVAVPAGKRLYAALHVLSASGTSPTLDVTVQSDVDGDFAAPTDVLTFTQATGTTSQILRTNGDANTDTFYRVTFEIDGTNPSFNFVVVLGVA